MLHPDFVLRNLSKPQKRFLFSFLLCLTVGYFTGLSFVNHTESTTPKGIIENYNGNEESVEEIQTLKFKKGEREMLTIIHTHILSLSFVFILLGILVWATQAPIWLKTFLSIEPFISVLTTFGGIYALWKGYSFFSYIVMISGMLMTLSYTVGAALVLHALFSKPIITE